jgi:RNA polymerase sigma factor (sigma-70 family)
MATKEEAARLLQEWQPLIWTIARDRANREHPAEDLVQEVSLVVWRKLLDRPDAPREYLSMVAKYSVIKALTRGKSVHRQHTRARKFAPGGWAMVQPDALDSGPAGWDGLLEPLRRRRGGPLSPVEDLVVAVLLLEELLRALTPEEAALLTLRFQGYNKKEACAALGLGPRKTKRVADGLRAKAQQVLAA